MSVTFKDFDIRYNNLKRDYPDNPSCSVEGCNNPVDVTMMGVDTSCSYHRLLFDSWMYSFSTKETLELLGDTVERRKRFKQYMNRLGKEPCDKIVLKMAQDAINWEC